jgi:hypothetical protein
MNDWSRQMGDRSGRRDRAAALTTQTLVDLENERNIEGLRRWPVIVAAMRALIAGYNEGAGLAVLSLVEDPENPCATVESVRRGQSTLVIALDGADLSVRTRQGETETPGGVRWVRLSRTDEETAEYLLRNWMEQL